MSKKQVTAIMGQVFEVDISDEVCLKFGFRHGDRIVCPGFGKGTVEGIACGTRPDLKTEVLWFTIDSYGGRVGYSHPSHIVPA